MEAPCYRATRLHTRSLDHGSYAGTSSHADRHCGSRHAAEVMAKEHSWVSQVPPSTLPTFRLGLFKLISPEYA